MGNNASLLINTNMTMRLTFHRAEPPAQHSVLLQSTITQPSPISNRRIDVVIFNQFIKPVVYSSLYRRLDSIRDRFLKLVVYRFGDLVGENVFNLELIENS